MTALFSLPAELLLLIADYLAPGTGTTTDLFALHHTCRYLRSLLQPKLWKTIEISTLMEDEQFGLQMISSKGHIQVGNINVQMFCEALQKGHLDYILPLIQSVKVIEETPCILKTEIPEEIPEKFRHKLDFSELDTRDMFAFLFLELLSTRKNLPSLRSVYLDRVIMEDAETEETAMNNILEKLERRHGVTIEHVMHPYRYGFNWFTKEDKFLFSKMTNITCYSLGNHDEEDSRSVLSFDTNLPSSLESFSLQADVVIDTSRFKTLFSNCSQLQTLELDINKVAYLENINWVPMTVRDLFIHVSNPDIADDHSIVKPIFSPSVERLALDGNFWNVLATIRFPNLKAIDLSVTVADDGIPEGLFQRSLANLLYDCSKLDEVVINFAIDALPLLIPKHSAKSVRTVRVSNSWRQDYNCTTHNTGLAAMTKALTHFPSLEVVEVALSGLMVRHKIGYILNTTAVILKSSTGLRVRFLAADTAEMNSQELFAMLTVFTETSKNCFELDRAKIMAIYHRQDSVKAFKMAAEVEGTDLKNMVTVVESVLAGR